jgi:hypothetical protein
MALHVQPIRLDGDKVTLANPAWNDELIVVDLSIDEVVFKLRTKEEIESTEVADDKAQQAVELLSLVGNLFATPPNWGGDEDE